jgi:hypothetical protein
MGEIIEEVSKPKNIMYFDEMDERDTLEASAIVPKNRICRTTGDEIKFYDDIIECDKPAFQEMEESAILDMFKHLMVPKEVDDSEHEVVELDSRFDFTIYDEEWYRNKFPGLEEETYAILVEADKIRNAKEVE